MPSWLWGNNAFTTVATNIVTTPARGTTETWQVPSSGAPLPQASSAATSQWVATVGPSTDTNPELVLVTNTPDSTHLTVQRGYGLTPIKTHSAGDPISLTIPDGFLNGLQVTTPTRVLLGQLTPTSPFRTYHQAKWQIVLSGTFVARSTSVFVYFDIRAVNQGGAFGNYVLVTGVNGGAPATQLFSPNAATTFTAAGGVTEFAFTMVGSLDYEGVNAEHYPLQLTGLTVGRVYTWQLASAMSGGAQSIATVGSNPYFEAITPDNNTLWVSNNGDNTVEVVNLGFRPGWRIGQSPVFSSAGDPIPVGVGPYGIAVSPNGQYVVVCNNTDKTVTAINARTHQVIGTTTVFASATAFATFTQDSTVCWISSADGRVYPLTMSLTAAPSIGSSILVRNANDNLQWILCHPDGKTLWVANYTANTLYAATLTTNTTLGAFSAATGIDVANLTCTNLATPMTYGTVAASITLTAAPFSFSVTNVIGAFPPQSKTILVPITATTYATITYQYSTTSGTTTTFFGCTGGAAQVTVAGTVILDQGVWTSGTGGKAQHIPAAGGAVDKSITANGTIGITGIWVSADNEEIWFAGSAKAAAHQISDGSVCLPAVALGSNAFSVVGSSDGFIYTSLYPAGKGSIFNWIGGVSTINPTYSIAPGKCVVSAEGVSLS